MIYDIMKRLFLFAIIAVLCLSSCDSNSSGLSKDKEEKIVRTETTKLAHYYAWEKDYYHFIISDLWNLLTEFKNVPYHRWDFGDYSSAKADQAVSNCRENAVEQVKNMPSSVFEQSYAQYMENYYVPSKYYYVSEEERFLADIYYAVYENSKPSVCEIAVYLAGVFKATTPIPEITSIQRYKNKEVGYYWEVSYDNGKVYRVKVVKMGDGSYGINIHH